MERSPYLNSLLLLPILCSIHSPCFFSKPSYQRLVVSWVEDTAQNIITFVTRSSHFLRLSIFRKSWKRLAFKTVTSTTSSLTSFSLSPVEIFRIFWILRIFFFFPIYKGIFTFIKKNAFDFIDHHLVSHGESSLRTGAKAWKKVVHWLRAVEEEAALMLRSFCCLAGSSGIYGNSKQYINT